MIPARLSFVTIGVRDLEAMRAFYRGLGWREAIATPEVAMFDTGGAVLGLYGLDDLARDARFEGTPEVSDFRGVSCAVNVESFDKVDEALESARAAGATIVKPAENADWGGRSGYFADPEGNLWEVAHMPGSSFDERGALILPAGE